MPIAIARGEVHLCERALSAKSGIHEAAALENLRPIQRRYETHTRDDVSDSYVGPNLSLMFRSNDVITTRAHSRDVFIQPRESWHDPWILVAQTLDQSHDKSLW